MKRIHVVLAVMFAVVVLVIAGWTAHGLAQGTDSGQSATGPSPAAVVGGDCLAPAKMKFKTADTSVSTTSTAWVNAPDMYTSFTISGTVKECLEVDFSASAVANSGATMIVRAILDSGTIGLPAQVFFSSQTNWDYAQAFNFAFKDVAPGSHQVKIQWKSLGGVSISLEPRSLIVRY
ncbi:MAG TPA: hypothetical protein VGK88_02850 [bacterium]|jgi:hypothetical protein